MKLDQDDVTRICQRVVDYDMDTQLVAEQFGISRRRVQQLAKHYRETEELPELDTSGRNPHAEHPADLEVRVLDLYRTLEVGATAIAHVLRRRDGLAIANNRVHEILEEYEHVTENPNKQGRKRPWVRFERKFSLVTVHMDWFHNSHEQWCLAVEYDASRKILGMVETDARSADRSVDLLEQVRQEDETAVPIVEVITDNGSEFINTRQDDRPCLDHAFESYLVENDIIHTLCQVGRPQSNGKIERFFQTYEKQRWRFDSLDEFLEFYNEVRPHMSLEWDNLETPSEAFDRLLPSAEKDIDDLLATEVGTHE